MILLRPPHQDELSAASDLCLRSKAHWGYDESFMAACVEELTLKAEDLQRDSVVVAVDSGRLVGLAQVSNDRDGCFLEKLFVNPADMGKGIGRTLFDWSCSAARDKNATQMIVEADPDAVLFYRAMGCRHEGSARSGSIPGRTLPRFVRDLTE